MSKRILAVASGGGHWQQLMLMRPAFEGHEILYLTTLPGLPEQYGALPAAIVPDANRNEKRATLACAFAMLWQVIRFRPHVVISTGALPGLFALAFGRLLGARTIWVDSVANAEEMALSGRLARRFAQLWLSQWAHVAEATGAEYAGSVL
jgi:hypothetical protein